MNFRIGRVQPTFSPWTDLQQFVSIFFESCDTIKARSQRKGDEKMITEIENLGQGLLEKILDSVQRSRFPVSDWYIKKTVQWINVAFKDRVSSISLNCTYDNQNEQDTKYAFKTHNLNGQKITLLEESFDPMGNEDGKYIQYHHYHKKLVLSNRKSQC